MPDLSPWCEVVAATWRERWSWAESAHAAFLDTLAPEIRCSLSSVRRDTNIVLYGASHSGKSTLALALLGVRDDALPDVEQVTRGGSPPGNSATAAATRYFVSETDQWSWQPGPTDPVRQLTDTDLRDKLGRVRAAMEAGRWDPGRIVQVGLPRTVVADADGPGLRILDLPGVEARKPTERAYVDGLVHGWVQVADVVLLVGLAYTLGFLAPDAIGIEGLRNWARFPERYRVVLTRTYSSGSLQDDEELASASCTPPWVHSQLLKQMSNLDTPAVDPAGWLYPLEFGESWSNLSPDTRAAFTPCRDAILDQLRDGLRQASRPETRIGGAFRAGQIARLIRQEEERRLEEQLAAVRRRLDQAHQTVESRRRSLDFHAAASAHHRKKCDLLAELRIAASDLRLPEPPQWIEHATAQEVRKELADRYAAAWSGWLRRVTPHFSPYPRWSDVTPYGAVAIRTRVAAAVMIIPWLHTQPLGNMIERYRRHLAARMVHAYRAATARLEDLLRERAGADLDRIAADLDQSGVLLPAGHQAAECRHTAARAMVRKVEEELRWAEDECCGGRQRLSAAVGVAEGFPTLLRSHYERQWRQAMRRVADHSDRQARLAAAIAVLSVARTYDRIRGGA